MANTISISDLKNIGKLNFEIPSSGVWLLTSENGVGKTTLLGCLQRIGHSNAFASHFPTSLKSNRLDDFSRAKVVYRVGSSEVEYAYRGERWAPRPRRNSALLSKLGYPKVLYVGANADRVTPRPEDFRTNRVTTVSSTIKSTANKIFETDKFDNLRRVKLQGAESSAFVLASGDSPPTYYSEKQFSLGELCVLKLIRSVEAAPNKSLILIDELELALHPRAQSRLYYYLLEEAKNRDFTVIFSTHSVTLIKTVPRSKIIYLERTKGKIEAVVGCFPTYVLGNIALGEERSPDVVLYVEDTVAASIVEQLAKSVSESKYGVDGVGPSVGVVPIGGFESVVRFLTHHTAILPEGTKSLALLDKDVEVETIASWKRNDNHAKLGLFKALSDKIRYLPWTPEVGLVEFFEQNVDKIKKIIRGALNNNGINISIVDFVGLGVLTGADRRDAAKKIYNDFIEKLVTVTAKKRERIEQILGEIFAKEVFASRKADILQILGPVI